MTITRPPKIILRPREIHKWYSKLLDALGVDYWLLSYSIYDYGMKDKYAEAGTVEMNLELSCEDTIADILKHTHIWYRAAI